MQINGEWFCFYWFLNSSNSPTLHVGTMIQLQLFFRCVCRKCSAANLESAREYRFCHDVAPAYGKVVFNGQSDEIKCVTLHEFFENIKAFILDIKCNLK